ncbi:hypothetical protein EYF80_042730 [Liparis tanakae]|uniref:Uncharacterized protein n=1 Tax=Liparis tanakae TaxID=230148 RepID=A0A4Z2G0G7_9TELE|nr:hypothetical protein EYF80_042730 [Liparis tanakae]
MELQPEDPTPRSETRAEDTWFQSQDSGVPRGLGTKREQRDALLGCSTVKLFETRELNAGIVPHPFGLLGGGEEEEEEEEEG